MLVMHAFGRLKLGITPAQARASLEVLLDNNRRRFPQFYRKENQLRALPLEEHEAGNVRLTLLMLLAAVGCVLLIAIENVANLLLARAAGRRREIAVRMAMGAGRRRIAQQLPTESTLFGLPGGAAGLIITNAAVRLVVPLAPEGASRVAEASLTASVLAFSIAVSNSRSALRACAGVRFQPGPA